MERFCQGDATAFDALFVRHSRQVNGYLARLVKNHAVAEELTQTTFLSLLHARGRFRRGARFRPWLYSIATNAARDHLRRKSETLTDKGDLPQLPDEVASASADRDVGLQRALLAALEKLPEGQRLPILMNRFEGLSFGEVAEALGLTETAVKVRAHRGYERLRDLLREIWEDR